MPQREVGRQLGLGVQGEGEGEEHPLVDHLVVEEEAGHWGC